MRLLSRSPRFVPLLASAVAGVLLVGSAGVPSYADSDEPGADPVADAIVDPGTPTEVAEDSLAAAEDLVAGESTEDPTLVLNQLSQTARRPPRRPTSAGPSGSWAGRPTATTPRTAADLQEQRHPVPEEAPYCLGDVCVHYVATTAARAADDRRRRRRHPRLGRRRPPRVMGNVWNREVAELGYRAPLPDRGTTPAGTARTRVPTAGLDVYLGDIGKDGYYGYAATDRTNPQTSSAYLVLDDDFKDFAGSGDARAAAPRHRGARVLPHRAVRLRPVRGRLVHGVDRHLDGGAGLRLGQRQPPVPPGQRAGAARAQPGLPADHLHGVRQLDLLRVPQPPPRRLPW